MILRRRRLWFVVLVGLFVLGVGLCVAFGMPLYVTRAQVAKIKPGMTLAEVETYLGKSERGARLSDSQPPANLYVWETWTGLVAIPAEDASARVSAGSPTLWYDYDDPAVMWIGRVRHKIGW